MTLHTKELIQYASATGLLITGVVMSFLSLLLPPRGVIDNSVLLYLGQCVIFCGAVFGIRSYINSSIDHKFNQISK